LSGPDAIKSLRRTVSRLESCINQLKDSSKLKRFSQLQKQLEVCQTCFEFEWLSRESILRFKFSKEIQVSLVLGSAPFKQNISRMPDAQEADRVKAALATLLTGSFKVDEASLQQHLKNAVLKSAEGERLYGASRLVTRDLDFDLNAPYFLPFYLIFDNR
jgi:hypothetical protein